MSTADLESLGFSLSQEEREDELIGYEPEKTRIHPQVPELSKKQWQTLLCGVQYRNLTYNQRIHKYVHENYPDLGAYYDSVGWIKDDLGIVSENFCFKLQSWFFTWCSFWGWW